MGNFNSHHVLLPKFTIADVAGVTFGGFLADKYICSQPNSRSDEGSPDVAHSGAAGAVPGISQPGVPVWDYITFPQAMIACCNRGKGWHLASPFEWAATAFFAKKYATQPHGGNANVDPPSDITYTSEIALLDAHLHGENGDHHRALPGTGPATWAHNHHGSGIFDLQGLVWQWNLMFMTTDGYPRVPANLEVSYAQSPYGRGTISGSGGAAPTLTVDGAGVNWKKSWIVDEFNSLKVYIAEAAAGAGVLYDITDTTATTIQLSNGDAPGDGEATFVIVETIATDITSGMTSGHKILTLRDSDADLKAFAIPATADANGSATYGNDYFSYSKAAERAAGRGANFANGLTAGAFALALSHAPSDANDDIGFRACKAL